MCCNRQNRNRWLSMGQVFSNCLETPPHACFLQAIGLAEGPVPKHAQGTCASTGIRALSNYPTYTRWTPGRPPGSACQSSCPYLERRAGPRHSSIEWARAPKMKISIGKMAIEARPSLCCLSTVTYYTHSLRRYIHICGCVSACFGVSFHVGHSSSRF